MQKTTTFFMFVGKQCGKAKEAMDFYISLFKNSRIKDIEYFKADEVNGVEGLVEGVISSREICAAACR